VGAPIDGDLVLQAVHARGARLGAQGAATQVTLDLPALPPPATGSFPVAAAGAGAARAPAIATLPAVMRPVEPPPQSAEPTPALPSSSPPLNSTR
jgi:general secretion pathway protein C